MSEQDVCNPSPSLSRKAYAKPAITHELKLETRAGSPPPTGIPPLGPQIDPLGIDPNTPR